MLRKQVKSVRLQHKIALVTDGSSESGRAIAQRLASEGATVVLNAPHQSARSTVDEYAEGIGRSAKVMVNALTSPNDVHRAQEEILGAFGRIDILVHNQNAVVRTSVEECDVPTFRRVMDTNVKTAFFCTQIFGQQMAALGGGHIVYISSIHDEKPTGSAFLYSASKGAIKMLCREAALDLGRHGIRVNVIEVGPIEGDDVRFASEISDLYQDYRWKVPDNVLGTPQDIANLVWFLVLDESRYLNGADIRMDGGFTLHYMDHKMKRSR